jgi:hypothetical protein
MESKNIRKGQAAPDFMSTHGKTIMLIIIGLIALFIVLVAIVAAVALFAMGTAEPSNFIGSKAAGFGGVTVKEWTMDSAGTFTIRLSNTVGTLIRLDSINVTVGSKSVNIPVSSNTIAAGEDSAILTSPVGTFGAQAAGTGYIAKVKIIYTDMNSGFPYISSGTLTGKVS